MSKYVIWDKTSQVITPIGEVLTAEEWKDRYPLSKLDGVDLVIAGDTVVNGAFCNEYTSFVKIYEDMGCDFTGCYSKQDYLNAIEQFEKEQSKKQSIDYQEEMMYALQDIAVNTMPTEEV